MHCGVSLLMAIPLYIFVQPVEYAATVHGIGTVIYIGLLLMFGRGFVIEGALVMAALTMLFIGVHLGMKAINKKEKQAEEQGKPQAG